jgi:phosphinothricin acetyltransferase
MQQIRMATEADGAACAAIYAPIVAATTIAFEVEPPTAAQMAARITTTLTYAPWLVLERDGQVALNLAEAQRLPAFQMILDLA